MSTKENSRVLPEHLPPHHEIDPGRLDPFVREKMVRDYYHLCQSYLWAHLGREPLVTEIMEHAQKRIDAVNLFQLSSPTALSPPSCEGRESGSEKVVDSNGVHAHT